jgi:hypothetical protein
MSDTNIRAPFWILYISLAILSSVFLYSIFAAPEGLTAWISLALIWLAAFVVFIAGYAIFTSLNQKLERNPNYITVPSRAVRWRLFYLIFGFILTSLIAWPLAVEISRIWG